MRRGDLALVIVIGIVALMCVGIAWAHAWRDRKNAERPEYWDLQRYKAENDKDFWG